MRTFEAGGFPAIIIPFFSEDWLDPEEGTADQARSTPPPPRLPPRRASPLCARARPAAPTSRPRPPAAAGDQLHEAPRDAAE